MKKNLILTGMMGVGKSTIGRSLSKRLKKQFVDIDEVIEKHEKMPIKTIFEKKGEKYFRTIEKKICFKSLQKQNVVISLGGGAFLNKDVRAIILKNCISFWLDVKINLLIKRLKNTKKRPLLGDNSLDLDLTDIYKKRKNIYLLADFRINCNEDSKIQIVNRILKIYEKI